MIASRLPKRYLIYVKGKRQLTKIPMPWGHMPFGKDHFHVIQASVILFENWHVVTLVLVTISQMTLLENLRNEVMIDWRTTTLPWTSGTVRSPTKTERRYRSGTNLMGLGDFDSNENKRRMNGVPLLTIYSFTKLGFDCLNLHWYGKSKKETKKWTTFVLKSFVFFFLLFI